MKKFILLIALFALILIAVFNLHYFVLKDDMQSQSSKKYEMIKKELTQIAQESFELKNLLVFKKLIQNIQNKSALKSVDFRIKKHLFTDKLLLQSNATLNDKWNILEVTTDAKYGFIKPISLNQYELIENKDLQAKEIIIRFQASKNSIIKNFLYPYEIKTEILKNTTSSNTLKHTIIENDNFYLSFYYDTQIDEQKILDDSYAFVFTTAILLILLFIALFLMYKYLIKAKYTRSISFLNLYLENTLHGKITKDLSLPKEFLKDFNTLHEQIIDLTKKYLNIANELSISKDIILKKEKTDELTGLPNKKSFENDLKHMFIANQKGYIVQLKIDKIGIYTQNHGSEIVDALIEDFAHSIRHYFDKHTKNNTIYRFFSGEFAMIIYEEDSSKVKELIQNIIELSKKLADKYYFFDNTVFYGATAFDQYGSIESIMQSAQDAYQNAIKENSSRYFIADAKSQLELNKKLENTVKDIISRNDFVIQYLHDTYSFDKEERLIMQEISPLIIDSFTFESIPSGKFISVAEKLGYMSEFDKALITKVLEQIELGELSHQIAIVLSVSSLSNKLFLEWLKTLLKTNTYAKQLIFTAPCYSIASNYEVFTSFSTLLKKLNHKFMIKRYDLIDLTLEKMAELSPSYIRLDKTLCQDFKKDSTKQHAIKQILLFCDNRNIKILGDSVRNEQDYLSFEMLGFYGTSK